MITTYRQLRQVPLAARRNWYPDETVAVKAAHAAHGVD